MQNKLENKEENKEEINEEINEEETKKKITKKRPRLYHIRKARQLGYFYNFETGVYNTSTFRKYSKLMRREVCFHFALGTSNKTVKMNKFLNIIDENYNVLLKPKMFKIIDKTILTENKNKFKKYFTLFKIFLFLKKQKYFFESKIFFEFIEKIFIKKVLFKLILNLNLIFENILRASKFEFKFMRKHHTVISRFSFRIFHHKKFKYVNKKTKKNRKEYKLIQRSEYKFKQFNNIN